MSESPSPELASVLRTQAFEEIERLSDLASSYSVSIREAAHRGDDVTVLVHLKQARSCLMEMIKTYKDYFDGQGRP